MSVLLAFGCFALLFGTLWPHFVNPVAPLWKVKRLSAESLRHLADQGNTRAQVALGIRYFHGGEGAPQNWLKAFNLWSKAAKKGSPEAQFHLGEMYETGTWVEKSPVKAFEWFLKSAEHGDAAAQLKVAEAYEEGVSVQRDKEKATTWYQKATKCFTRAAEQGDPDAQFGLGRIYEDGKGMPQDLAKAFHWMLKSAEQGVASAQFRVAMAYDHGLGVPADKSLAASWYTKAFRSFNEAVRQGDESLSLVLAFYIVPEPRYQEWLLNSAEQGDPYAQLELAKEYDCGFCVVSNHATALQWFAKAFASFTAAAEGGDKDAQFNLGIMYKLGQGAATNVNQAIRWLVKAGDQGHEAARRTLEDMQSLPGAQNGLGLEGGQTQPTR